MEDQDQYGPVPGRVSNAEGIEHALGLDHFEGRTWRGWHHHVTLVTGAHAFLTLRRYDAKAHMPD